MLAACVYLRHATQRVEPAHLLLRHDDRGDRRGVEGLVLPGVVDGCAEGEKLRDPPAIGGSLDGAGACDGLGGEDGHPETAVGTDGLLQREVVGIDLPEIDR